MLYNSLPLKYDVFYKKDYTPFRRCKLLILSDIFKQFDEFNNMSFEEQTDLIKKIENSCYNATIDELNNLNLPLDPSSKLFNNIYSYICTNLFQNIDPNSEINSTYLIKKIFDNEINIDKIGYMNSEELCPEKTIELKQQLDKRASAKYSMKSSTMYRCSKCKKNECVLERMHTRGLDELTNYRATCIFCKHTWVI